MDEEKHEEIKVEGSKRRSTYVEQPIREKVVSQLLGRFGYIKGSMTDLVNDAAVLEDYILNGKKETDTNG